MYIKTTHNDGTRVCVWKQLFEVWIWILLESHYGPHLEFLPCCYRARQGSIRRTTTTIRPVYVCIRYYV